MKSGLTEQLQLLSLMYLYELYDLLNCHHIILTSITTSNLPQAPQDLEILTS